MTTKTIACKLGISVRTVNGSRMLERLGTKRIAKAIKLSVLANFAKGSCSNKEMEPRPDFIRTRLAGR